MASGGVQIDLSFDSSVDAAPAALVTTAEAAAAYLDTLISTSLTLTIDVGYGEVAGLPVGSLGESEQFGVRSYSYQAIRAAMQTRTATPAEIAAAASLPAADPTGGGDFELSSAEAEALGLSPGPATGQAVGAIGLSSADAMTYSSSGGAARGTYDAFGVILHELTEVLGRTADVGIYEGAGVYSLLDLFRYSAPGVRDLSPGAASFSPDGRTLTAQFNNSAVNGDDAGDWAASMVDDSFDASSNEGVANTLSPVDLTVMDVLGYSPVGAVGIAGTTANQATTDSKAVSPFASVTLSDSLPGESEAVTVSLSSAANGTLRNLGGGSYDATRGVYTVSGTVAAVAAAVEGLIFTPTTHQVPPGQIVTTRFTITETDAAGHSSSDTTTTVVATAAATPPLVVNTAGGGSYVYAWFAAATVRETVTGYSGSNGTGVTTAVILDRTDGSSMVYVYNPTSTVTQTMQDWSATDSTSGAPAGTLLADLVDNADGTSDVYAYNPTSTVTRTMTQWSAANPDGSAAGTEAAAVVNSTDGTTLVYTYNPAAGVAQATTIWSATDPANGAAEGIETAAVIDNTDGSAIVYALTVVGTVTETATFYAAYDRATGAPIGGATSVTVDYRNGQSSITTSAGATMYYSGPDGTGTKISAITGATEASRAATSATTGDTIVVTGMGQMIDPGAVGATIQFLSGAADDTVVLQAGRGADTILGFDPASGDALDLRSLFASAGVYLGGDLTRLPDYVTVRDDNGAAAILFDPTGHGGGAEVALLAGDGGNVVQFQAGKFLMIG
jgi:hypothetical protein